MKTHLGLVAMALGLAWPLAAEPLGPSLDLRLGWAVPIVPQGSNAFSESYTDALQPGLGLNYRMSQDWQWGLDLQRAEFSHQTAGQTTLTTWACGLEGEWDGDPESYGPQDHFYAAGAIGAGGVHLDTSALFQSRQWVSAYLRLGLGWSIPIQPWLSGLVEADAWGLLGPGKADPIATASLSLGLRFGVAPKQAGAP